jgi:hypothetical protein
MTATMLAHAAEIAHAQDVRRKVTRQARWERTHLYLYCVPEQAPRRWVQRAGAIVCQACGSVLIASAALPGDTSVAAPDPARQRPLTAAELLGLTEDDT